MKIFSKSLIKWYAQNKRPLPWRNTKNPYNIWVSEIILQQTRVNQGLSYYYKFIERYPNIFSLAETSIDDLMKVWQGLGYYSRARNMHYTANYIVKNYKGKFPKDYNELLKLKGIGEYTAGAIASFAFNCSVPVLDGNVYRVLSRVFGIFESTQTAQGKRVFFNKAKDLILNKDPGTFNQAIMEFGALHCTPNNPDCTICPLSLGCFALENNKIPDLPVKKNKIKIRTRYFHYTHILYNEYAFIEKRAQNDIWKFLYQLPLIETKAKKTIVELTKDDNWIRLFNETNYKLDINFSEKIHLLSHQKLISTIYKVRIEKLNSFILNTYIKIPIHDLGNYGFPKLLDNYLKDINN